ncbi:sensor domain-containing protein [Devosia nitrariae]|uniref:Bifunctional diguanylate cyclase/phosphodiesterase n=1 Tax=Devosia nitrariae TaxID=2071872 RepID=A0ABQ5WAT8_9HYPH|nr:EAL domain-containing protein [Devosia nitrariae]GLQ56906.1 bifunctional diguanylate cyclase/phosphodiesterase [Devosia nitrariae]
MTSGGSMDPATGPGRGDEAYFVGLAANCTDRAVLVAEEAGPIVYCNDVFCTMFGFSREEVIGALPLPLLGRGDMSEEAVEAARADLRAGKIYEEETLVARRNGETLCLSATLFSRLHTDTGARHTVFVFSNITESKQIQSLQRDVLEAIARDMPLVEIMDLLCRRVEAIAPDVTCSVLAVEDGCVKPLAAPRMPPFFSEAIDGLPIGPAEGSCGTAAWRGEPVVVADIENDPLWAHYRALALPLGLLACWSSPIKLRDGQVAGTFAFYYRSKRAPSAWHHHIVEACVHLCVVAIERALAKAHIDRLAYYDALTGLPNRTMLRERIGGVLAGKVDGPDTAMLFLDVDHFKDVNDTLGHSVGDKLLVEIAQRLRTLVGRDDLVGRLSGDEFVILLQDADGDGAARLAQQVLEAMHAPVMIEDVALPASVSIGISLFPADGMDGDTLLKHADSAMYQAKGGGRATYRFFSPRMNSMAQDRLLLGAALREAIANGDLELHYQPQIATRTGELHAVEALARWTHPEFGPISPGRFIALAEESGQIETLGEWGIEEACRQMGDWRQRGIAVPSVSVNISPLHFRNRDIIPPVRSALARHGIEPQMLTIEITERVILDDCPMALENAHALDALGVRLSMDDFGTGYSSLSHLASIPARELKIDRSFMKDLLTGSSPGAIVTAVVRIGQSLGMTVVAEGVETSLQHFFLETLGCDVLQGYLFSPALPPPALEAWLKERNVQASALAVHG